MPSANAVPSMDQWLAEAKAAPSAENIGMFLTHTGIVRRTSKAQVRCGGAAAPVTGMLLSCDQKKVDAAIHATFQMPGIYYIKVWINEGTLTVGEDIMHILIGGDIRPHVADALEFLTGEIKAHCISETELF